MFVPLIAVTHPAQFAPARQQWLAFVVLAPLVAALCVRNPAVIDGMPREPNRRLAWPTRRALLARRLRQSLVVLTMPAAAAVVVMQPQAHVLIAAMNGDHASQRPAAFVLLEMTAAAAVTLAVVVAGCRRWDKTFAPLATAVTEKALHQAVSKARHDLRALEAHNAEVEHALQQLHAQLLMATSERDFHQLRQLHRESHQCGTVQRDYFQLVLSGCRTLRWLSAAARTSAVPRVIPLRDAQTGQRQRLDAAARTRMRTAAQEIVELRQTMERRTDAALLRVNQLNMGTAELRDRIRDECGSRGWDWYQERAGARLARN